MLMGTHRGTGSTRLAAAFGYLWLPAAALSVRFPNPNALRCEPSYRSVQIENPTSSLKSRRQINKAAKHNTGQTSEIYGAKARNEAGWRVGNRVAAGYAGGARAPPGGGEHVAGKVAMVII
jgi:hypothetical protein